MRLKSLSPYELLSSFQRNSQVHEGIAHDVFVHNVCAWVRIWIFYHQTVERANNQSHQSLIVSEGLTATSLLIRLALADVEAGMKHASVSNVLKKLCVNYRGPLGLENEFSWRCYKWRLLNEHKFSFISETNGTHHEKEHVKISNTVKFQSWR